MRSISYGGGVQSTAMVVLAVQGKIDADAALFANVGHDSEHPATLTYVRDIMKPWAAAQGFPIIELQKRRRDGTTETLMERLTRDGSRSLPIPVRMSRSGAPGTRSCTVDHKVKVIARWHKEHGATADDPATVLIGFSTDEIERAGRRRTIAHEVAEYPLLDLRLDRAACQALIARAGLPVPPKSACFFCPFHTRLAWQEMARDEPDLFARSVALERLLNERRRNLGKDPVYLTRYGMPLDQAINPAQDQLPGFESIGESGCDEGVCFV